MKKNILFIIVIFLSLALTVVCSFGQIRTTIEKKEGWKEVFIDKAYYFIWCGEKELLLKGDGNDYRLVNIYTKEVKKIPIKLEQHNMPICCSSNGNYVFIRKFEPNGGLIIFNKNNMEIKTLPLVDFPNFSNISPSLLSPNDGYFVWHSKGKLELDKQKTITFIPVFSRAQDVLKNGFEDIAWAPNSKKLFLLTAGEPQSLITYDILSTQMTTTRLELRENFYGKRVRISSNGNKLYIQAILDENKGRNLYELDLFKVNSTRSVVRPELLRNDVWSFDISADNLIVFHMVPPPDAYSPYPKEYAGLYLADSKGKVVERLTRTTIDTHPQFSKDGQAIAFIRTTVKPMVSYVHCLIKVK